jgi:hypothetical protein
MLYADCLRLDRVAEQSRQKIRINADYLGSWRGTLQNFNVKSLDLFFAVRAS